VVKVRLTPAKKTSSEIPRRAVSRLRAASEGIASPASTDDTNERVSGAPSSAWLRPRAVRRRRISVPSAQAKGVPGPASDCLAIVDSLMRGA
jgi:hypothetical protein